MINQRALDKIINGLPEERVFLCEKDFSLFLAYYFGQYIKYKFAPFHFEMFEDLKKLSTGEARELAWVMFRESAKTSITQIYVIWLICYKKRKYINIDSFDKENAERFLFDMVVSLQSNQPLKADFGELFTSKRNSDEVTQKRVSNFVTNNGIRVEAHSTQESVRGRKHGEQRPDFLVLDDFETNKTKDSKAYTLQVIKHMDEFKSGLAPNHAIIYLCNFITEYGSVQTIKERAQNDPRLIYRDVPVIANGLPTWPSKYTLTDAEAVGTTMVSLEDKRKQLGSQVFMAEMMNMPIDDTTAEFKKEWTKTITEKEVDRMVTRNFGTIDPAYSQKDSADDIGICINKVNRDNNWHIKAFGIKMTPKDLINMMFVLWDREKLEAWGVEEGVFDLVIKPFLDDEMRSRNKYMTVVKVKHGGIKKETRIRGLLPRYESGSIYHVENECLKLEDQLRTFPRGMFDDVLDSLSMQIQIANPPFMEEEYEEPQALLYPDIGI